MSDAEEDHNRKVLLEAFTAGWQAGLAVTISNPRVLAVVESCFELWLQEAVDERDVLGLSFRGRPDLPTPSQLTDWPVPSPTLWSRDLAGSAAPRDAGKTGPRQKPATPRIPTQRSAPEDVDRHTGAPEPEPRPASTGRDLRRLLTRSGGRSSPKHRDVTTRDD